jgi:ABC-2 type transport system permease protein
MSFIRKRISTRLKGGKDMNIYRREMRANRRSLILWSIGMILFIAASMGKYSALISTSQTGQAAGDIMSGLPVALQAVFGVGQLDFTKASGFWGMIFPYLMLMAAIHASMLGAVILSKEERDRTSEFLYVKPATRARVVTSKLLAALTCVAVLFLVTWGTSAGLVAKFGPNENAGGAIATLMLGFLLVQLVFLSLGFAAAALVKRPKASAGIATGVMLAMYLLSIAITVNRTPGADAEGRAVMAGKLDWLMPVTPFEYFDAKRIIGMGDPLNAWYVALCAALVAVLICCTYFFFKRRDLKV